MSDIDSAVETLIGMRPFLEPILRPLAAVCREKAGLVEMLVREGGTCPVPVDASRLEQGATLCNGMNVHLLKEMLGRCFPPMLAVLDRSFARFGPGVPALLDSKGGPDLAGLSGAFLDGDRAMFREAAGSMGIEEWGLDLAIRSGLSPVLGWVAASARSGLERIDWGHGYCPVCRSMPDVSFLTRAGELGSEFLVGGGGKRYLHCSLCGYEWTIPRTMCPACRNDDHGKRMFYQADGVDGERVDVCLECRGYLPCIDLRQTSATPPMEIAAVGMVHLDVWAVENGYRPLAQTPWNAIGG